MPRKVYRRGRLIPSFVACFYVGVMAGWWLHVVFTPDATSSGDTSRAVATSGRHERTSGPNTSEYRKRAAPTDVRDLTDEPSDTERLDPSAEGPSGSNDVRIGSDPIAELRRRDLRLPILGADVRAMERGFYERRSGGSRGHEAVDILAPRDTPIYAVDDGVVARLFTSKAGGLATVYQFDPTERFCYYYAHLQRYADGLHDGQPIRRGQVVGYVGTSGNAPPNTPHLHFAVFELTASKQWSEGTPLDPYLAFNRHARASTH